MLQPPGAAGSGGGSGGGGGGGGGAKALEEANAEFEKALRQAVAKVDPFMRKGGAEDPTPPEKRLELFRQAVLLLNAGGRALLKVSKEAAAAWPAADTAGAAPATAAAAAAASPASGPASVAAPPGTDPAVAPLQERVRVLEAEAAKAAVEREKMVAELVQDTKAQFEETRKCLLAELEETAQELQRAKKSLLFYEANQRSDVSRLEVLAKEHERNVAMWQRKYEDAVAELAAVQREKDDVMQRLQDESLRLQLRALQKECHSLRLANAQLVEGHSDVTARAARAAHAMERLASHDSSTAADGAAGAEYEPIGMSSDEDGGDGQAVDGGARGEVQGQWARHKTPDRLPRRRGADSDDDDDDDDDGEEANGAGTGGSSGRAPRATTVANLTRLVASLEEENRALSEKLRLAQGAEVAKESDWEASKLSWARQKQGYEAVIAELHATLSAAVTNFDRLSESKRDGGDTARFGLPSGLGVAPMTAAEAPAGSTLRRTSPGTPSSHMSAPRSPGGASGSVWEFSSAGGLNEVGTRSPRRGIGGDGDPLHPSDATPSLLVSPTNGATPAPLKIPPAERPSPVHLKSPKVAPRSTGDDGSDSDAVAATAGSLVQAERRIQALEEEVRRLQEQLEIVVETATQAVEEERMQVSGAMQQMRAEHAHDVSALEAQLLTSTKSAKLRQFHIAKLELKLKEQEQQLREQSIQVATAEEQARRSERSSAESERQRMSLQLDNDHLNVKLRVLRRELEEAVRERDAIRRQLAYPATVACTDGTPPGVPGNAATIAAGISSPYESTATSPRHALSTRLQSPARTPYSQMLLPGHPDLPCGSPSAEREENVGSATSQTPEVVDVSLTLLRKLDDALVELHSRSVALDGEVNDNTNRYEAEKRTREGRLAYLRAAIPFWSQSSLQHGGPNGESAKEMLARCVAEAEELEAEISHADNEAEVYFRQVAKKREEILKVSTAVMARRTKVERDIADNFPAASA